MAESFLEFTGSRGRGPYPFHSLDFLSASHLSATVDDVPVSATFDTDRREATLAATPAATAVVRILRTTPRTAAGRLTQFLSLADGAAGLTGDLLDQDYRQLLFAAGEARDTVSGVGEVDGMYQNTDGQWAALAKRLTNVTAGDDPFDLVTKAQLDAVAAGAYNLPAVSGSDNDDGLFVSSAAWAKRLPAECRAHLGLGSVATLAAGTSANNVIQLDSNARYPAADGRNIDITANPEVARRALATVAYIPSVGNFAMAVSDPAVSTWSQSSATRLNLTTAWNSRVELNNSGDVDGSTISPYYVRLAAGTWRIRFMLRLNMVATSSATNRFSFRITNNDDTSGQTVYFDLGLHRPSGGVAGNESTTFVDTLTLSLASAGGVAFRASAVTGGVSNLSRLSVLFHKVSTST